MLRKLRKFQQQIDFYNADAELLGAPLLIVDANALEIRISIEELEVYK